MFRQFTETILSTAETGFQIERDKPNTKPWILKGRIKHSLQILIYFSKRLHPGLR